MLISRRSVLEVQDGMPKICRCKGARRRRLGAIVRLDDIRPNAEQRIAVSATISDDDRMRNQVIQ